jgi:transposase
MTIIKHRGPVWVGLDVHKDSIEFGLMSARDASPALGVLGPEEVEVRRFVSRAGRREQLKVCYEAGPTGYELYRLLTGMGVYCEVIAPSLIPKAPGEKVKADRRGTRRG